MRRLRLHKTAPLTAFLRVRFATTLLFASVSTLGCEQVLGVDFERRYVTLDSCVPRCGDGTRCNPTTRQCDCDPLLACEADACGAILDPRCGEPIDCGSCPSGQYCGSETPNRCSTVPCRPLTCAALGQTSGLHPSCGILVDCNPSPTCQCAPGQLCTAEGCCDPFTYSNTTTCGPVSVGCGRVVNQSCRGNTELLCGADNTCCKPSTVCDEPGTTCGVNAKCGIFIDCEGSCPEPQVCNYDASRAHHYCGDCTPQCPTNAVCGPNPDVGCNGQNILCDGTCPAGEVCVEAPFRCCRPACPATPTACGGNDDGCGGTIQCPGPCPIGQTCVAATVDTFACSP